jgi:hypothetical protein
MLFLKSSSNYCFLTYDSARTPASGEMKTSFLTP